MAKVAYEQRSFQKKSLERIQLINDICARYEAMGYDLTVRQVYYQLVTGNHIANNFQNYKTTAGLINDARLAGLIDWNYIVDRTRNLAGLGHWDSPADIIKSSYQSFRLNKWEDQPNYVEVWVEKDALSSVIQRVANELDVNYFACKGYVSQSEMRDAARRFDFQRNVGGKKCHLIHLGDHDPSGIHMTSDITDRLNTTFRSSVEVHRIALTMAQIEQYNPPENPAKETDSRFAAYAELYGDSSWELDALEVVVMHDIIEAEVLKLRDESLWEEMLSKEKHGKVALKMVTDHWGEVEDWLKQEFDEEYEELLDEADGVVREDDDDDNDGY